MNIIIAGDAGFRRLCLSLSLAVTRTMQRKYILLALAVIAAFVLMSWLRSRSTSSQSVGTPREISFTELSEGEQRIQRLIREVYGDAILNEKFVQVDGSVKVEVNLDTNKTTHVSGTNTTTVKNLSINLSSLARKQRDEGLSDGVVKASVRF